MMQDYQRGADWRIQVDLIRNGANVDIGTSTASLLDAAFVDLRIGDQVYKQYALAQLPGYDALEQDSAINNRLKGMLVAHTFTKELPQGNLYVDVRLDYEDLDMPDDIRTELVTMQIGRVV
jgi:hypothetical protein